MLVTGHWSDLCAECVLQFRTFPRATKMQQHQTDLIYGVKIFLYFKAGRTLVELV